MRRPPGGGRAEHGGGVRVGLERGEGHGAQGNVPSSDVERGRLITVEGLDGAGKTTLASGLARALARARAGGGACCASRAASQLSERIRALRARTRR